MYTPVSSPEKSDSAGSACFISCIAKYAKETRCIYCMCLSCLSACQMATIASSTRNAGIRCLLGPDLSAASCCDLKDKANSTYSVQDVSHSRFAVYPDEPLQLANYPLTLPIPQRSLQLQDLTELRSERPPSHSSSSDNVFVIGPRLPLRMRVLHSLVIDTCEAYSVSKMIRHTCTHVVGH